MPPDDEGEADLVMVADISRNRSRKRAVARAALEAKGQDCPPPSRYSRRAAVRLLKYCHRIGFPPERIMDNPEGGVGLHFFGGEILEGGARNLHAYMCVSNKAPQGDDVFLRDLEMDWKEFGNSPQNSQSRQKTIRAIKKFVSWKAGVTAK